MTEYPNKLHRDYLADGISTGNAIDQPILVTCTKVAGLATVG